VLVNKKILLDVIFSLTFTFLEFIFYKKDIELQTLYNATLFMKNLVIFILCWIFFVIGCLIMIFSELNIDYAIIILAITSAPMLGFTFMCGYKNQKKEN